MKSPFTRMLFGGDYNPNQWPREVWQEDMRMFNLARINSASVNIFSWAQIQPSEDEYDFAELDDIVDMLAKENSDIVLATATAAMPAWLFKKYPEVSRVDFEGRRHVFGMRHNHCPNSLVFQKYAARMAGKLAERYADNPRLTLWHVSNEYGGLCYCENCAKAFRVWLKNKYKTLDKLNEVWNMDFWSHRVYEWDEIVVPNALGDGVAGDRAIFAGLSIDYRRFMSDSLLENYKMERDAIRVYDKKTPITTNLMGFYKNLDYFKWAKEMDIVSWDNYPAYDTPWSRVAMTHDLMRGLKDSPFLLMEQTPSQQNWQAYNSLKRPNQMRAQSWQTVAHGGDSIQYFQLRRSKGACEKFHGAVIAHCGHENTRVFREVSQLGHELEGLGDSLLGADNEAQVGLIFDWENYWALEYTSGPTKDLTYVDQLHQYYRAFYERNIPVDMVPVDADFSKYKIVLAPVLYMVKDGMQAALEKYVANGGTLITSFMSGIADETDNVHLGGYPGPLRKLAGVWVEEIDALAPEQSNGVRFADGTETTCNLLCDLMHTESAEVLASYTTDFYAGMPVVTKNTFGKGAVYYVGAQLAPDGLSKVLLTAASDTGVASPAPEATKLEITRRHKDGKLFTFIINFTKENIPMPGAYAGKTDAFTGEVLTAKKVFKPFDAVLLVE